MHESFPMWNYLSHDISVKTKMGLIFKFTIYLAHLNAPFSHQNAFTTRNDGKNIVLLLRRKAGMSVSGME